MKTILVLFGGCSTEYEVSLHSAYAVLSHMDPARYTPLAVGITREGQWLCYTGDLSRLEDVDCGSRRNGLHPLHPAGGTGGPRFTTAGRLRSPSPL